MVTGILCNRTDYKKNRTVQHPKKAEQTRARRLTLKEATEREQVEASNKKEASEERNNHSKEVSEDQDNRSKEVGEDQDNDKEYTNGDADMYQPATDDDRDPAPSDGEFRGDLPELTSSEDVEEEEVGDNDRVFACFVKKKAKKADPRFETQTQGGSKIHHIFIPPPVKEKPHQKGPAAAPSVIAPHQPTPPPSRYSTCHKVSQQVSYTPILTICS
ncbi:hypothetical protein JB92DRAFT_2907305 [Gautieria morchelliformis]|nr:hypothetical protein JB92DRAFT_2907305 [Gautieria morchelliformis]